jgi:hypothetical protein
VAVPTLRSGLVGSCRSGPEPLTAVGVRYVLWTGRRATKDRVLLAGESGPRSISATYQHHCTRTCTHNQESGRACTSAL